MAMSGKDSVIKARPIVKPEDIMTMVDPVLSCESALNSAPYVISSLGHLLLISAEEDFSLIDHLPKNTKFTYLKHPDSFRACLVQVSNGVWRAFEQAHISMERIRLKSLSIDRDVTMAVKFIKEGGENELPIVRGCLEHIDKQSDECVKAAASITDEFQVVVDTMNELQEACTGAKGRYDKERKETISAHEAAAKKQKFIEKGLDDLKVRCDEEKDGVKRAEKEYENAMNSYPSTWKIMLCGSVDQVARFARDVTASFVPAFLLPAGLPVSSTSRTTPKKQDLASPAKPTISNDERIAYLAASDILKQAELLLSFANDDQNGIEKVKEWFQENLEELRESPSDAISMKNAVKLSEDGTERCQDILNCLKESVNVDGNAATGNPAKKSQRQVTKNRCKKFHEDAISFNEEATKALSNLDCDVNDDVPQPDGGTLTTILLQNAERKRQEALKILRTCYERYERCQEKMLRERRKMEKVLDDLARFDSRTIDLNKIRDALRQGMKALSEVIQHWRRFHGLFQWLRVLISDRFRLSLERFLMIAQKDIQNFTKNKGNLIPEVVIKKAEEASQIAFMVQSVSALYVEVSQVFFLNGMNSLQAMVSLDPELDREEMEYTRREIQDNCKRALGGIEMLARERRRNIRENIMKQQENIDGPSREIPVPTPR